MLRDRGMTWMEKYDSIMKHCNAWYQGEDFDPESGIHHMAHAGWDANTLAHYAYTGAEQDDRPLTHKSKYKTYEPGTIQIQVITGKIKKRHLNSSQSHYEAYTVVFHVEPEYIPRNFSVNGRILSKNASWKRTRKGNIKTKLSELTSIFDEDPVFISTVHSV